MTTYPLGITGVTPFAYFPPVGNVDDVVGGTWTESGNALTGYSGSAGGVYVGANADVTGATIRVVGADGRRSTMPPTVPLFDCEAP